jgi:sporulation protein YlmC with PRC-barrel domain
MKTTKTLLALTAGGLMAFAAVWPAQPGEPPPIPTGQETATETNKPSLWNKLSEFISPSPQFEAYRSQTLFGSTVRGSDHAKLGEFGNCLIDLPQGRIVAGLVSSGGLLGIGETVRAIPVTAFRYDETEKTLTLTADNRTFRQAPAFDASQMNNVAQLAAAYRQFGQEPYWLGGTRQAVRETDQPAGHAQTPSNVKKATQLIGMTVRDSSQQDLGEIRDLVLDLHSGHVLYAVLAQGGILGVNDKLHPIPPQTFGFSDNGKALTLNATREQLERAPQFTKASWPALSDPKWASDVYTYHHAPMYWRPPHADMTKGATELMRQPVREAEGKPAIQEPTPALSSLSSQFMAAIKADEVLASVADRIQITEEGGTVTLTGEVDSQAQKDAAAKAAKNLAGVTHVDNQITVRE